MRKTTILIAILFLQTSLSASDALWQRAVAIAAYNRDMVPGTWVEREETFDAAEDKSHIVTQTTVAFRKIGSSIDVSLVESRTNGMDVTEEIRGDVFEQKRPTYRMKAQYNPFLPAHQSDISARPNGRSRRDGEVTHIAYDYSQKTDDGRWRGTAWIDARTGMPLAINARLTGLPRKNVKDEIKAVVLNVPYESGAAQAWYPAKVTLFTRAMLNNFPYTKFFATIEKAITLSNYWKITFE